MALITIDDVALPTPNQYNIPMQDMTSSDSSYSESGLCIRNRVRQGICRLELAWRVRTSDAATILTAVKPDKVTVQYLDPRTGTQSSAEMYVEDRSCSLIKYQEPVQNTAPAADSGTDTDTQPEEDPADACLWEIAFNLVEY